MTLRSFLLTRCKTKSWLKEILFFQKNHLDELCCTENAVHRGPVV